MFYRSKNPALNDRVWSEAQSYGGESMSIQGAVNKCFIMLFLAVMSASWIWGKLMQPISPLADPAEVARSLAPVVPLVMGGGIVGFILVVVTGFKLNWSPVTAPLYAVCEGFVLGGVSAMFERRYPGIAIQAVSLTFGTLFCLLMAYRSGLIHVTDKMRLGLSAALGGIFLVYITNMILGFFHRQIPFIYGSGPVSIGFSLIVVCVAALFLVIDFDLIERYSAQGAPKFMEWYGAMSLLITLVWLYFEILTLLAKLRESKR